MENNLNVVGIIRTMDDLGRIVIPKEIRRVIGVKEGDSLDILATTDGSVLLRKVVNNQPVDCPCAVKTEPATKILSFVDHYNDNTKVVKVTAEQEKFLDWLLTHDFVNANLEVTEGYPDIEDLT